MKSLRHKNDGQGLYTQRHGGTWDKQANFQISTSSESNAYLHVLRSHQHFLTTVCVLFVCAVWFKTRGSITNSCLISWGTENFSLSTTWHLREWINSKSTIQAVLLYKAMMHLLHKPLPTRHLKGSPKHNYQARSGFYLITPTHRHHQSISMTALRKLHKTPL